MREITSVHYSVVQRQERIHNSSVRLDNHHIPDYCPIGEIQCYKVLLDEEDIKRIFLLFVPGFYNFTNDHSYHLADVTTIAWQEPRVSYFRDNDIDIRTEPGFDVILFGQNFDESSLTATDGNHRLIAQFLTHGNISNVPAFICIHENIHNWMYLPPLAREL